MEDLNENPDSCIDDEVELIREISCGQDNMDGVVHYDERRRAVTMCISPDDAYKFVQVKLQLRCGDQYPSEIPEIDFKTSRGLSDTMLENIRHKMLESGDENLGSPMLYQLIETCQEHISESCALPSDLCAVCLVGFHTAETVHMTPCAHFVHRVCFGELLEHHHATTKQTPWSTSDARRHVAPCPVCCADLAYNPSTLGSFADTAAQDDEGSDINVPALMADIREEQHARARVYARQRDNGGIIDNTPARVLSIRTQATDNAAVAPSTDDNSATPSPGESPGPSNTVPGTEGPAAAPPSSSASAHARQQQQRRETSRTCAPNNATDSTRLCEADSEGGVASSQTGTDADMLHVRGRGDGGCGSVDGGRGSAESEKETGIQGRGSDASGRPRSTSGRENATSGRGSGTIGHHKSIRGRGSNSTGRGPESSARGGGIGGRGNSTAGRGTETSSGRGSGSSRRHGRRRTGRRSRGGAKHVGDTG
eukprot:m.354646 g.354646  ORF g.354646 m.354646 type:complete len:482 (+) comp20719_c0_seq1:332-1777(+)